ncbi:MAG: hypothetical protein NUV82_00820 [Candidatus Komeilibacteria bacterium]|nr:hypothetical protein [Candidatus Komeilibacteria bacterium]
MTIQLLTQYYLIFCTILIAALALFVINANPRRRLNQIFFLIAVAYFLWFGGSYYLLNSATASEITRWTRVIYSGVIFLPALFYHFSLLFSGSPGGGSRRLIRRAAYLLALAFFILSHQPSFIDGVFYYEWGAYSYARLWHHYFLIFFASIITIGLWELYKYFESLPASVKRQQTGYVMAALLISVLLASIGYLPAYGIAVVPISYIGGIIFPLFAGWACLKYRFLGIKYAARQLVIMVLTLVLVGGSYCVLIWLSDFFDSPFNISAIILLAGWSLFVRPVYHAVIQGVDKFIFKKARKYEETRRLSSATFHAPMIHDRSTIIMTVVERLQKLYKFTEIHWLEINNEIQPHRWLFNSQAAPVLTADAMKNAIKHSAAALKTIGREELMLAGKERKGKSNNGELPYEYILPVLSNDQLLGLIFLKQPKRILLLEDFSLLDRLGRWAGKALQGLSNYRLALQNAYRWQG